MVKETVASLAGEVDWLEGRLMWLEKQYVAINTANKARDAHIASMERVVAKQSIAINRLAKKDAARCRKK